MCRLTLVILCPSVYHKRGFLPLSEQGASNYYCINPCYKSPCIFSVAAGDRLWASTGREWVTYNMMDSIAHLSPR